MKHLVQNHTMFQQEEAESEGVQPNVSPSWQSNSSSVKPVNQLPSNLGGSAHQPQLYEAEIARRKIWTAEHLNYYRPLFHAAERGDCKTAKSFIDNDPRALTAEISIHLGTVLHIAAHCCQWKFVLMLLELDVSTPQSIAKKNASRATVLHYVAEGGSLKTAEALVEKNADLPQMVDNKGYLPLLYSFSSESKELVRYLSLKTRVESPNFPYFIPELPVILHTLIQAGYHDIALYFVQRFPHLALAKDEYGNSLLKWLAENPSHFLSGSSLGFLERWIYKLLGWLKRLLWKAITQLVPILAIAVEVGNEEIVRILLRHFPDLMYLTIIPQRNLLQAAIELRQEKIIGRLAPPCKLFSISGAALQMQRELQWFKEVEKYTQPADREPINRLPSNLGGSAHQSQLFYMPNSSSEERIHQLPSNLGGSAHQSQLFYMPNSSSEERIHQLPSNLGGSAHQSDQFSESEIEFNEFWTAEYLNYYQPLFNAAQRGDWKTTKSFIDNDQDAFTAQISISFGTVLHIAAQCGQWKFVIMLLELNVSTPQSIAVQNVIGSTVLHFVADSGSLKTAKALVEKNANLLQMVNNKGCLPLVYSVNSKNKELVWYLCLKTRVESPSSPFFIPSLPKILRILIQSGYHAILTAQYDIEDFLESLPKKLIIGLGSLFFAIATMIIAFAAALTTILNKRWHLVYVPITLVASIPVAIFVMLQLPLSVQMVQSTYGASIFCPWPSRV
ncbi:hypothetical protein EZV62_003540 [Acer yangbiense]|uniref:PGG domain-containing protein n=1 Tax=Acer yangbiense TaxID=1000413 RepID=A0A5C7IHP0_9ROSI|nr:hypothetical protein EZV62_003540 [Acer yangbiense]